MSSFMHNIGRRAGALAAAALLTCSSSSAVAAAPTGWFQDGQANNRSVYLILRVQQGVIIQVATQIHERCTASNSPRLIPINVAGPHLATLDGAGRFSRTFHISGGTTTVNGRVSATQAVVTLHDSGPVAHLGTCTGAHVFHAKWALR